MIDSPPMAMVDTAGVRCLRLTVPNLEGIDLYTAIDRVVRAVGRMVVWVEAAAELRTISKSRWLRTLPKPDVPNTALPRPDSTSFWLAVLPSPTPLVPSPAKDWVDMTTSK